MFRVMQQFLEKSEQRAKQPNALDILPIELRHHVFSFFQPAELPATKFVSREFNELAKAALKDKLKNPEQIILAIAILAFEQVVPFIEACQNLEMDFTNSHYTVICKALMAMDITTINAQQLQNAIDAMSEEQRFAPLLNGLRITKAAIEGKTDLVSTLLKNRSALKPYVNLSGADLTGIDLSNVNLDNVNFQNANLIHAELSAAELGRANLDNADLTGTSLHETKCIMQ